MSSVEERLKTGFVYCHKGSDGLPDLQFNAFEKIMGDVKRHEVLNYPSVTTSLSVVYGNDFRGFSVKCYTRRRKEFKAGAYKDLRTCQFSVTGRFTEHKSKAFTEVKKCVLYHNCQEPSYIHNCQIPSAVSSGIHADAVR